MKFLGLKIELFIHPSLGNFKNQDSTFNSHKNILNLIFFFNSFLILIHGIATSEIIDKQSIILWWK